MTNSGIYKIVNKITGDFYIGSAVDLHRRFTKHAYTLRSQKHRSPFLQNVFNKYGAENLLFKIIEYIEDVNKLIEVEQFYIDNLKPRYNICKLATSRLGVKCSEITKERIRKANLGKHLSEDHKRRLSENASKPWLGKHRDQNTKNSISTKNAKEFRLVNPSGELVVGKNLSKFCKANNLDHSSIYKVLAYIYPHHKGWTRA